MDSQSLVDSIYFVDFTHPSQQENKFIGLIPDQRIAIVPEFTLECGEVLYDVPVAFKTWGALNKERNNCLLLCHALSGSADAADWWGPMLGPGRAFDPTHFFIVCLNSLGSPYGSASPVTWNSETKSIYGPEFPLTTVRDDVALHKLVLQRLGVEQIAMAVGGSMGGMLVLEWAFDTNYVRSIVPISTSLRHSAWCISWSEAQRQSIYSDPKFNDGFYDMDDQPLSGLGAARMSALLTYRSKCSFERRFARKSPDYNRHPYPDRVPTPMTPGDAHWVVHNEGNGYRRERPSRSRDSSPESPASGSVKASSTPSLSQSTGSVSGTQSPSLRRPANTYFSAQSYLRYQAKKFVGRFDANCYISITKKLDTHDVSRDRGSEDPKEVMKHLTLPVLVLGIESDGLFTYDEQVEIASCFPNGKLETIISAEGHDGFLLEFTQVNSYIQKFEEEHLGDIMSQKNASAELELESLNAQRESVFGEMEDITSW
ncbi:homoserine O-acetyltransferase [Schizosaccharomyces octosporus yFS286]|uniref:Homoserine O-acetyltransferase n=1 Tax=Schizosaccharomyces octosporus (strain yFS286) TaxID=483514 RepID=S9PTR7_SCHOY|nr:homoserine O-acetyltransferase [Schizosaccharomyces octosporus yFS286]EPX71372.1 homoserine O-acetyltransferase [Schizosaccharomyces octosporus yFS286]